jgi:hypothetical protein
VKIAVSFGYWSAGPGYEAPAPTIQDFYLAGDKKSAIAAVPTKLVEDVALIGPWAKITDEIQRWKRCPIVGRLGRLRAAPS